MREEEVVGSVSAMPSFNRAARHQRYENDSDEDSLHSNEPFEERKSPSKIRRFHKDDSVKSIPGDPIIEDGDEDFDEDDNSGYIEVDAEEQEAMRRLGLE